MLCGCLGAEEGPTSVYVKGAASFVGRHVDSVSRAYDTSKTA